MFSASGSCCHTARLRELDAHQGLWGGGCAWLSLSRGGSVGLRPHPFPLCCSYGLCGIHYIDAGYLGFKAYFVAPRKGTVWVRGWCRVVLSRGPW